VRWVAVESGASGREHRNGGERDCGAGIGGNWALGEQRRGQSAFGGGPGDGIRSGRASGNGFLAGTSAEARSAGSR